MGRDRGNYIGYRGSMNYGPTNQVQPQSFVQGSLGSKKGDINYDAFSDFDNDGMVSTADFAAYNAANPNNASMIETPQAQYSRVMGEGIMGGSMYQQPMYQPMYQPLYQPMYNPSPMPISSRQQFGFGGNSRGKANTGQSVFGMADGGPVKRRELSMREREDPTRFGVRFQGISERQGLGPTATKILDFLGRKEEVKDSSLLSEIAAAAMLSNPFREDTYSIPLSPSGIKKLMERLNKSKDFRDGGLIKGYQDGGPMLDPMMGMQTMDNLPVSDMDMMSMESGMMTDAASGSDNEMLQIVMEAKAALEGRHPDPVAAIERFVEVFGEEELMSLKDYVIQSIQTGEDQFSSDGMSDSIPGNIDGVEPVALSEGEYVVPADVVSGLGNGDTQSGANRMREMIERVRMAKNGSPEQPPAIDPSMFMNM